LSIGSSTNNVLPARENDAADGNHFHVADGLADNRKGVVADFPIRDQIVGPDEIAGIYAGLWYELVNVDRARGFQGNVFQFLLRHLDVGVGIDLVAFHNIVVRNFLASVRVHLQVLDAVAGVSVDLVEAYLLGIGSGRIQSDRAGNKGKA
jgi:hypothetical protein